ncbi:auxin efflux carrier component 7-like [Carica papaya]|uniref:auxin efflux carrier component 7-like n=1 Tax=Carica papaya TaxID=3649 RepID=UPI000B8C8C30|nr:auxin efflux carrier component 7-like [Carica papaya]
MIGIKDLYCVLTAVVPLYVTMFLAYASVKWWNIFSPDQCAGINRFVAILAVPLLSFEFISRINPYRMNLLFLAADGISKLIILFALLCWANFSRKGNLDWAITLFSLSSLPNTLVMGIPLLKSMYGDDKEFLMVQVVVLQCIMWYTLLLFLFEYRAARNVLVANRMKLAGNYSNERNIQLVQGGDELVAGAPEEDEVVGVVVASGLTTSDSQKLKPIQAAAIEGDCKQVHLFIWRCGCCVSQGVCEKAVQVFEKEESNVETMMTYEKTEAVPDDQNNKKDISSPLIFSWELVWQILKTVWFKLLRNPNSYASVLGITWALISCRWDIKKPEIMDNSVTILSKAGLGMAMFSLGLFMALQPRLIACGKRVTVYWMVARFMVGPGVMGIASVAVGLRGTVLKLSIVQAALPQAIVPFVFAREYNLHPHVLSTAVIFGMIVSLPITILYYILLGL